MYTTFLRALREKNNFTQESFAEKLNVPKRTYASWERGERTIPHEILISIANMFNVSIDYLLGREEDPVSPDKDTLISLSSMEAELLNMFRSLNADGQRWLLESADNARNNPKYSKQDTSSMAI